MQDLCAFPKQALKAPRLCCTPFCGKSLASLNKRELCYTCQNRHLFQRTPVTGAGLSVHGSGRR